MAESGAARPRRRERSRSPPRLRFSATSSAPPPAPSAQCRWVSSENDVRVSREAGKAAAGVPTSAEAQPEDDTVRSLVSQKASFELSGALADDGRTGNVFKGVRLKWSEPSDAATPGLEWQLHVFKGEAALGEPLRVHKQSAYLFGRDRSVCDVGIDHPSCSKQHAVLQFRRVPRAAGAAVNVVKPYLLDLESANGTLINGEQVAPARYVELRAGDVLRFGCSTREYVLLHPGLV